MKVGWKPPAARMSGLHILSAAAMNAMAAPQQKPTTPKSVTPASLRWANTARMSALMHLSHEWSSNKNFCRGGQRGRGCVKPGGAGWLKVCTTRIFFVVVIQGV